MAKVVQQNSNLQMRVITFNSPSAIIGAVQNKPAEFTFTSNHEAGAAYRGIDEDKGRPMTDLRIALTVMPFAVGIMVKADSDIKTVADLKSRKFPTGWQGFRQGIPLSNAMLATAGLSLDDMEPVPAANLLRAADDFKAGRTARVPHGDPDTGAVPGGGRGADNADGVLHQRLGQGQRLGRHRYELVKSLHPNKAQLVKGHPSFNAFTADGMAVRHLGIGHHRVLGQGVETVVPARLDLKAADRAGVDDMPAFAVALDQRHEGLDAVDDAMKVDADHPVEVPVADLIERRADEADAGVVHQHIDAPETPLHVAGRLLHPLAVGDVEDGGRGLNAEPLDFGTGALERRLLDVGGGDVDLGAGQRAGDAEADARRRAGDEGGLSLELPHLSLPWFPRRGDAASASLPPRTGACSSR